MKKRLLCVLLILCTLTSTCAALDVSADSVIVIDADTGAVLFEKNADKRRLIASTTKIMTALIALESFDMDAVVQVPDAAARIGGSSMYLAPGSEVTVHDLLYGLLLQSGNDAAYTLASAGGDVDGFVEKMNQKAEKLKLSDTHFTNPHGLDDESHYSTARDMAQLASYALENEEFITICACKSASVGQRMIKNHNKLLSMYDGVIGVKTGFTKAAGRCLVSAAEREGRRVICVTLNAPDDWSDHMKLYDDVFSSLHAVTAARKGECAAVLKLAGGGEVKACYASDVVAVLLGDEEKQLRWELEAPAFLYSRPESGKILGYAKLFSEEKLLSQTELIAE